MDVDILSGGSQRSFNLVFSKIRKDINNRKKKKNVDIS